MIVIKKATQAQTIADIKAVTSSQSSGCYKNNF